ncbi:MAG: hypothetical protein MZV63_64805 [Marinilabiliales bacterium]|nr:hypothetical protein [Marinilabiliales bacterium]
MRSAPARSIEIAGLAGRGRGRADIAPKMTREASESDHSGDAGDEEGELDDVGPGHGLQARRPRNRRRPGRRRRGRLEERPRAQEGARGRAPRRPSGTRREGSCTRRRGPSSPSRPRGRSGHG